MWSSSCVLLSCWLELKLNQAGTIKPWKDLNVRYFRMVGLRAQNGWWGCGMLLPATTSPSPKMGDGVPCLCYGVRAAAQENWTGDPLVAASPALAFLPCLSAFPFLTLVQLCTAAAAANSSRVPLQPLWTCCSPKPGELVLSQPGDGCLCAHRAGQQHPEVTTWKPGMSQPGDIPGRGQSNVCSACWQFAWLQPKGLIVRCINIRNQAVSILFQRANTQLWNHLADLTKIIWQGGQLY